MEESETGRSGGLWKKGRFFVFLTILPAFGMLGCSSPSCPRRRASRRGALGIAGVLDSRLRGNDDSALRVVKNLPLKGAPYPEKDNW